jgi:hypothetical protein
MSTEEGGVRIVDQSEGKEINVDSGVSNKQRNGRLAEFTSVKVLYCTS